MLRASIARTSKFQFFTTRLESKKWFFSLKTAIKVANLITKETSIKGEMNKNTRRKQKADFCEKELMPRNERPR